MFKIIAIHIDMSLTTSKKLLARLDAIKTETESKRERAIRLRAAANSYAFCKTNHFQNTPKLIKLIDPTADSNIRDYLESKSRTLLLILFK
ncbi:hypothetical protein HOG75_02815, partial [bacterium]|nr:hypothetical protein [bacterium]